MEVGRPKLEVGRRKTEVKSAGLYTSIYCRMCDQSGLADGAVIFLKLIIDFFSSLLVVYGVQVSTFFHQLCGEKEICIKIYTTGGVAHEIFNKTIGVQGPRER